MIVLVIISQDHEDLLRAIDENNIELLMKSMFLFQSKNYMKGFFLEKNRNQ
jgi:hypothetical protein